VGISADFGSLKRILIYDYRKVNLNIFGIKKGRLLFDS
jgi:hypothetical protein